MIKPEIQKRLTDSVETALQIGKGLLIIDFDDRYPEKTYSEQYACSHCGIQLPEIEPRVFSFNSPYGACPDCNGLGTKMEIDPDLLISDKTRPWIQAIAPWQRGHRNYLMYYRAVLREIAHLYQVDPHIPFTQLDKKFRDIVFYGSHDEIWGRTFEGVLKYIERLFRETDSEWLKDEISKFMSALPCPGCDGKRLKPEALAIRVNSKNIAELSAFSIDEAKIFFNNAKFSKNQESISQPIIKEIIRRLDFCVNVGLGYLTLDRKSATLSGGEAERIRLATQVGSGLVESYIFLMNRASVSTLVIMNAFCIPCTVCAISGIP